jgi:hypothetical protein
MKCNFFYISIIFLIVISSKNNCYSFQNTDSNKTKTILEKTAPKSPFQIIKESVTDSTSNNATVLPGSDRNFSPEQDSAYFQALRTNLPINTIISKNLQFSDELWRLQRDVATGTPWQLALENIKNVPPEFYNPSPVEVVNRQIAIENSFYIPFVKTLPRYGTFSMEAIGKLLGLTEDISSNISYTLDYTTEIEVVVYSISSAVVSTMFRGRQVPGSYSLRWNGRDDLGKPMPPGDYIAEVRVGKEKYIRKRIVLR